MKIIIGLINGMLTSATPILLAALGGSMTYYAGIFNIAMEGMMLSGAFFAVLGSYYFQSWVVGILFAILGALLMAGIFILFAVVFKMDEFITGIGLNLLSLGLTTYLVRQISIPVTDLVSIPDVHIPGLKEVPVLGEILSGQNLVIYLTLLAVLGVYYTVFKTRFGLRLRAAGYNRACLDTSGVSANRIRVISLLLCGVLCGLAGAFLSLGVVEGFTQNMSAGKGWISLAAVILVSGNPTGIALISLLFGFTDGLGLFMQKTLPPQFSAMVPYVATLIALFVYSVRIKKKITAA